MRPGPVVDLYMMEEHFVLLGKLGKLPYEYVARRSSCPHETVPLHWLEYGSPVALEACGQFLATQSSDAKKG